MILSQLEEIRKAKGLSRSQVARALDMSERQLFRLERGHSPLKRVHLLALAEVYGVGLEELGEEAIA